MTMSSVFGVNSNFNTDARKTPKYTPNNGLNDSRRSGTPPVKKKSPQKNQNAAPKNQNGYKGSRSNKAKPIKPTNNENSVLPDPLDKPIRAIPRQAPEKLQAYTKEEIQATGELFPNPQQLGFRSKNVPPRPYPKYLISQPRLLYTPPFVQNTWDKQNQEKMLAIESASTGLDFQGLYEEFQKMRDLERRQMETFGLVDAENTRKDLNDAIAFQGSCLDMCPIFERARRALENNVKNLERDPATNKISRERAVKAFSRPAAGQPPPLPSDVRPPHVLVQTLNYLVDNIVHQLPEAHSFIWDRTRSIRQDFTYQNSFGPETIDCNERIVRIHLLSLHIMGGSDQDYSQQQELEQFNKALQTLIEIYDDVRNYGGNSPNEAEFRAYHLLSHIRDPELEKELQNLPNHIFQDPNVQLAIRLRNIISQNNVIERGYANSVGALNLFTEFFRIVYSEETPFLMACLLETRFNEFRFYALKAMSRSFHTKGKAYTAEGLKNLLGFDSVEKLVDYVSYYEIDILHDTNGEILVDLFNKEKLESTYKLNSFHDKAKQTRTYSSQLDRKIQGKTLSNFINQGRPNTNLGIKQEQKILNVPQIALKSIAVSIPPVSNFGRVPSQNGNISVNNLQSNTQAFNQARTFANPTQTFTKPTQSFGQVGQTAPGFGQKAPSFANKAGPPVQSGFGVGPASGIPTPKATQFQAPSIIVSQPRVNSEVIQPSQPKVDFSFSKNKANTAAPSSKFEFKLQNFEPTKISSITSEITKPISMPKVIAPREKKLVDHPQFSKALEDIVNSMIKEVIGQELEVTLLRLIQVHRVRRERELVIESLGNELYQAFLSEVIHEQALASRATHFHNNNLKKKAIRSLSEVGSKLKQMHELKRKKEDELNSVTFKVPKLKRRLSVSSMSSANNSFSSKRRSVERELSKTAINARQEEIHQLWSPLDIKDFVVSCSKHIQLNLESQDVELQLLLVVENWSSSYSKWLNTKLQLKSNADQRIYESSVKNEKVTLKLTSLPSNNYLNKDFFSKTSFIVFECGMVSDEGKYPSIQNKLQRDCAVLKKIVSLAEKYSYYQVQILIIYWDVNDSNLSDTEISNSLGLGELGKNSNIQNIHLSNMSAQEGNINDILVNGFNDLKNTFNGNLTKRGLKRKVKLDKLEDVSKKRRSSRTIEVSKESVDLVKEKELKILEKAKRARHYNYLSNHAKSYPSSYSSNGNNSQTNANTTANGTANKSILARLTHLHHRNNNSMYSDTASFSSANTTVSNASILTGFGLGVIEESTPPTSPNSKPKTNVPNNVQQLRDLTMGIRSRFK